MRLLVVVVVTVALLAAAAPLALTQAPRLHSPVLALLAFGVAVVALVAGVALLVRAMMLHRRTQVAGPRRDSLQARIVSAPRSGADASAPRRFARLDPAGDDAETDPRPGPERILLVPTSGRIAVSAGASLRGPRHALDDEAADQSRQDPDTTGQSPAGPSQTHAQQTSADDAAGPAVDEAIAARSASFAARYTATRSRR